MTNQWREVKSIPVLESLKDFANSLEGILQKQLMESHNRLDNLKKIYEMRHDK